MSELIDPASQPNGLPMADLGGPAPTQAATSNTNTTGSDNPAKYHVRVRAKDSGVPEGLSRVLDMLNTSIQPQVPPVKR